MNRGKRYELKYGKFNDVCRIVGIPSNTFDLYVFMAKNEDEELTSDFIAEGCGFSEQVVQRTLKKMFDLGLTDREFKHKKENHGESYVRFFDYFVYHPLEFRVFQSKILKMFDEKISEMRDLILNKK